MSRQQINVRGTDVLLIGAGVIGFFTIKKLLVKLGIASGAGNNAADRELRNPNSPWKGSFYKSAPKYVSVLLIRQAAAEAMAKNIHNAFTIFQDDFNSILGVFRQLKTKSQVSFLSEVFYNKYGEDMLSFLGNGGGILPWDGLSDAQLKKITDLVNNLPQYKAN